MIAVKPGRAASSTVFRVEGRRGLAAARQCPPPMPGHPEGIMMAATLNAAFNAAARPFTKTVCFIAAAFALLAAGGCQTYVVPPNDAELKASLTDVLDLYSQRLRLVSRMTVIAKDKLKRGTSTLAAIASARTRVVAAAATPALANDPIAFARFDVAQRQLTEAVSALMVEAESEPRLNSDATFRALQGNLAIWSTRIGSARTRYDQAAQIYNATLHTFPHNIAARLCAEQEKPVFSVMDRRPSGSLPHIDFRELRGTLRV
ncbi:LemA family protein [Paraburkholderia dioscoreae]|uniref:LemA family protein n=1 Tax=Paraburkholderia dioscoreae TaxID=2604047 RepID=UPI001E5F3FA6|nr:LemA family protein [Paraburkholderia dioscoreae]MDR8396318.1 LemA family protein [Paraburkholderia sp. USG1]